MSRSFSDVTGRVWHVNINAWTLERVKTGADVDLLKIADDNLALLGKLGDDFPLLVGVLFSACEKQAKDENVTPEQFGASMRGDALLNGYNALIEATIEFFPKDRAGKLKEIIDKVHATSDQLLIQSGDRITKALEGLDPKALASSILDKAAADSLAQQHQAIDT